MRWIGGIGLNVEGIEIEILREMRRHEDRERGRDTAREAQRTERRRKESLLSNMACWREGQDLEEFVGLVEENMDLCQVPLEEKAIVLGAKLAGEWASLFRELRTECGDYQTAGRDRLLEAAGFGN